MQSPAFTARADLGFAWSVKDSFLQYIRGMRDGHIAWDEGAAVTSNGEFFFPLSDVRRTRDCVALSFGGSVTFTAHHGLLAVSVSQPRIVLGENAADLFVGVGPAEAKIATVELSPPIRDGDVTMWLNCAVALSDAGPEYFGGTYSDGEQLARLTIRVPARSLDSRNDQEEMHLR